MNIITRIIGLGQTATASVYGGSGIKSGAGLGGIIGNGDPRSTVFRVLNTFLSYKNSTVFLSISDKSSTLLLASKKRLS